MKLKLFLAGTAICFSLVGCSPAANETKESPKEEKEVVVEQKPLTPEEVSANLSDKYGLDIKVSEGVNVESPLLEESITVIMDNAKFAEEENLEEYNKTMIKSVSENPESTASTQNLFDAVDIDYEILDMNIQEVKETEVIISIKQKAVATYIAEGQQFRNHIADATHTLTVEDGALKLSSSEANSVDYLE